MVETIPIGDVVDQQGADGTPVVGRRDTSVPFLSGRVPDLCLHELVIVNTDRFGRKFNTDGGFGILVKFILRKPKNQIRFPNTRIAQQDNLKNKLMVGGEGKEEEESMDELIIIIIIIIITIPRAKGK